MTKEEIIKALRDMARYPTVTLPRDSEALKVAADLLAQPEQKPVAWMNDSTPSGIFARHMEGAKNFGCTIPLYTTLPQRKPLTDEEINDIAKNYALNNPTTPLHFARAIEAAHGIKGEA